MRESEFGVFLGSVEAGALFTDARKVAMTEDLGIRIVLLQGTEKGNESGLLFGSTGVGRTTLGVETSFIADADGVLVVVAGMGADEVFMTRLIHLTVPGDVVVIGGEAEASLVTGDELGDREWTVAARGAAVDDDEVDAAHLKN